MKKYLVIPGEITSKSDGEEHFISAIDLMSLYNVNPKECVIQSFPFSTLGLDVSKYTVLRPRYDGNYEDLDRGECQ